MTFSDLRFRLSKERGNF